MSTSKAQRIGIQFPLGFSAGMPLLLTGSTLTAWLASEKVSLETVGIFALVSLPYNLKFLWAPLLDRYHVPFLGRRRGWILTFQLLLMGGLVSMGTTDVSAPFRIACIAGLIAFLSASQDVVIDAYRTDLLGDDERGQGTAAYVAGYRIALIFAGAGALILADHVSWQATYALLAGLLAVGMVATWRAPALPPTKPPANLRAAVFEPMREFFGRRGAWLAIAFVALYKFGDSLALHMVTPFLLGMDFSMTDVGLIQKFLGMAMTIVGCTIGGILADRMGVMKALLLFGLLQAFANVGYLALAITGKSYAVLVVAIGVDQLCNGLGTAAFVAFLMSLCHRQFSATQYALFGSASSLLGRLLGAFSGYVITAAGWAVFFATTIAIALPALAMVPLLSRRLEVVAVKDLGHEGSD